MVVFFNLKNKEKKKAKIPYDSSNNSEEEEEEDLGGIETKTRARGGEVATSSLRYRIIERTQLQQHDQTSSSSSTSGLFQDDLELPTAATSAREELEEEDIEDELLVSTSRSWSIDSSISDISEGGPPSFDDSDLDEQACEEEEEEEEEEDKQQVFMTRSRVLTSITRSTTTLLRDSMGGGSSLRKLVLIRQAFQCKFGIKIDFEDISLNHGGSRDEIGNPLPTCLMLEQLGQEMKADSNEVEEEQPKRLFIELPIILH